MISIVEIGFGSYIVVFPVEYNYLRLLLQNYKLPFSANGFSPNQFSEKGGKPPEIESIAFPSEYPKQEVWNESITIAI